MNVKIVKDETKRGFRLVTITAPGALNRPILRFPLKLDIGAVEVTGTQCPIHTNYQIRADSTCVRAATCQSYKKRCPAR